LRKNLLEFAHFYRLTFAIQKWHKKCDSLLAFFGRIPIKQKQNTKRKTTKFSSMAIMDVWWQPEEPAAEKPSLLRFDYGRRARRASKARTTRS
jgi:hypothetical protein